MKTIVLALFVSIACAHAFVLQARGFAVRGTPLAAGSRFQGKIALVTGGSSGMGKAVVRGLEDEGAVVVVADIIDDKGEPLCLETKSTARAEDETLLGPTAHLVRLDVRSQSDWITAVSYCESLGGLDVLVNAGGILNFGSFEDADVDGFRKEVDVNQVGVFIGIAAASKLLKQKKGCIVNLSSMTGLKAFSGIAGYVASAWGIRGMTKAAALELGSSGVRVNSVHAGPIETPSFKDVPMKAGADLDDLLASQPIKRAGLASEVANAVLFLASSEASYITGAELAVDGGASLGNIGEVHHSVFNKRPELSLARSHREW